MTLDLLPATWSWARLGDLLSEPPRNGRSARVSKSGAVRCITLTAVTRGDFSRENTKLTALNPSDVEDLWLQPGDILIERSNTPELVGTARLYGGAPRFAIFPDLVIRIRVAPPLSPRFLELALQSDRARRYFRLAARGIAGSMPKISQEVVEELRLAIPPQFEQERIVNVLDTQFTRLDDAVASLEHVLANLRRYRASVLKAAVEGRLVPTEAELARREGRDYERASVLLDRILRERRTTWEGQLDQTKASGKKLYKEPKPPETDGLPTLPIGWCWATSDQLLGFVTSGSRGWAKYYAPQGPLFITVGNLDHLSIKLDLRERRFVRPPPGVEGSRTAVRQHDLLISITADVGMVGLVSEPLGEAYINQHVALARPVDPSAAPYLAWFLTSDDGQRQFSGLQRGATKQGLGLDDLRRVLVALPPLVEQQRIGNEIERHFSIADRIQQSAIDDLRRIVALRQSVLSSAFEGRLVEQDPNDQPVSSLLNRIAAARDEAKSPTKHRRVRSTKPA